MVYSLYVKKIEKNRVYFSSGNKKMELSVNRKSAGKGGKTRKNQFSSWFNFLQLWHFCGTYRVKKVNAAVPAYAPAWGKRCLSLPVSAVQWNYGKQQQPRGASGGQPCRRYYRQRRSRLSAGVKRRY
jgi:hypothetical protein